MIFKDLEKALSGEIVDLKPAPIPDESPECEMVTLDRSETNNAKWLSYITAALRKVNGMTQKDLAKRLFAIYFRKREH